MNALVISSPANRRAAGRLALIALVCAVALAFPLVSYAAAPAGETAEAAPADSGASGMAYVGAALAIGLAAIGSGIAVAAAAPAAIGAFSEDPKAFGKALIFVALGEGIALYGVLIAILILNKV